MLPSLILAAALLSQPSHEPTREPQPSRTPPQAAPIQAPVWHVDLAKLPAETRTSLFKRAQQFAILEDGTIIDRTNELALHDAIERDRQAFAGDPGRQRDSETIARGLRDTAHADTKSDGPPLWSSVKDIPSPIPATEIHIFQAIGGGEALADIFWDWMVRGRGDSTFCHLSNIDGEPVDQQQIKPANISKGTAGFYIVQDAPATYSYNSATGLRTVPSFKCVHLKQEALTQQQLADAIVDGSAVLSSWDWYERPAVDAERGPGITRVIEWTRHDLMLKGLDPRKQVGDHGSTP